MSVSEISSLAIVHDWLVTWGGAERLLESALEVVAPAPLYTLIYNPKVFPDSLIRQQAVHTSLIDRLPYAHKHHRWYLPLMPFAIEQFDLRRFKLIFSISHAVAHGVLTRPEQRHISYSLSPVRYAWHQYHASVQTDRMALGRRAGFARLVLHYLRLWDFTAAQRVDRYLAVSEWVKRCIWRAYRREAEVLYPPVDVELFSPLTPRQDYYLLATRLVPYKKAPEIVEAFNRLGLPLVVAGDGPDYARCANVAGSNVRMLGFQPDRSLAGLMGQARAFIYMAEEDFGLAMAEAQAAGCPVIAYRGGGASEIVREGETGLLYNEQTGESLIEAVQRFEAGRNVFDARTISESATRFSKRRFHQELIRILVEESAL